MKNAVNTRVHARMRRAVKDSMTTTMKSGVSTVMRRTMHGTTKNVVCRHV
ncbi:MAG: hypothetical protein NTX53_17340 [candidate division WOR-3 bacterium]|nr:hypothetical protein [candidate division WOR-3 bacterium]